MASKHISQAYIARICDYGIGRILERIETGETVKSVAVSLGMSRGFLSTFMNKDPFTADTLALCRAIAAQRRLATHADGVGRPEAREYATSGPAMHLEALERINRRATKAAPPVDHGAYLAALEANSKRKPLARGANH